jgi:hypothetical protein
MTREHEVDAGPLPEILDRLGDRLEEVADSLEEPEPVGEGPSDAPSPNERLDEEFSDLDTHLSALARRRREEIKAGVSTDEFTPLRHALLQSSGTRYAARSLRTDVETLIENTRAALAPRTRGAAPPGADSRRSPDSTSTEPAASRRVGA